VLADLQTGSLADMPIWLRPVTGSPIGAAAARLAPGPGADEGTLNRQCADLMPLLQASAPEAA
jgi:hypothetical protein